GELAQTGSATVSAAEVEASVAGKSGETVGLFAEMAAHLAGAPATAVEAYADLGRALGIAWQLRSDVYDIFSAPRSSDLVNGARTLPVALHLDGLAPPERAAFVALLDRARVEEAARDAVRRALRAGGVVQACAVVVEAYC